MAISTSIECDICELEVSPGEFRVTCQRCTAESSGGYTIKLLAHVYQKLRDQLPIDALLMRHIREQLEKLDEVP